VAARGQRLRGGMQERAREEPTCKPARRIAAS
jgi:hypothetical protein